MAHMAPQPLPVRPTDIQIKRASQENLLSRRDNILSCRDNFFSRRDNSSPVDVRKKK